LGCCVLPTYIWNTNVQNMTNKVYHANTTCITYHTHFIPYVTLIAVWRYNNHNCWNRQCVKHARREKKWYTCFLKDVDWMTTYLIGEYDNTFVAQNFINRHNRKVEEQRELQAIIDGEL